MIDAALERVPNEHRFTGLAIVAAVLCVAAGYVFRTFQAASVIHQTRVVRVQKSWGAPDQALLAAQVNPQLAQLGMTRCDYYASRKTLVCHP